MNDTFAVPPMTASRGLRACDRNWQRPCRECMYMYMYMYTYTYTYTYMYIYIYIYIYSPDGLERGEVQGEEEQLVLVFCRVLYIYIYVVLCLKVSPTFIIPTKVVMCYYLFVVLTFLFTIYVYIVIYRCCVFPCLCIYHLYTYIQLLCCYFPVQPIIYLICEE